MRLLSVSDEIIDRLQSPALPAMVGAVDLVVGCGDLPPSYLEYLVSVLNVPCVYVHGNHDGPELRADGTERRDPRGCTNLDLRVADEGGLLIAGIEGILRYRNADYHYSEAEWQRRLLILSMRVWWAQQRANRRLDVLITHTPPQGLHDGPGAHRGPVALRRFIERMRPRYVIHGHVHPNYGYGDQRPLRFGPSLIINTCGYRVWDIPPIATLQEQRA